MERQNPIEVIRARHKLSQQEKAKMEDAAVSTDLHEIAKREAYLANEGFHDAYFEAMSLMYEKQESFEELLLDTSPRRWLNALNSAGKWIAIAILFFLLLQGCIGACPS